jgi:hypothetical protein
MIKSRAMLLAGVSALAMLACGAEAKADTTPGKFSFIAPSIGEYALDALGAMGRSNTTFSGGGGGLGAAVSGDIFLIAEPISLSMSADAADPIVQAAVGAGAGAVSSSSGHKSLPSPAVGAAARFITLAVRVWPGSAAGLGEEPTKPPAGRLARVGTAAPGGPLGTLTAAAARASTPAPRGTAATAMGHPPDPAGDSPMAAAAFLPATTTAATAAAAAPAAASSRAAAAPAAFPTSPATRMAATAAAAPAPICRPRSLVRS